MFGINQGYVADGHNGANHVEFRLGGEYSLTEAVSVAVHASYNLAIDRDAARYSGDVLLRNFPHLGIGLTYEF